MRRTRALPGADIPRLVLQHVVLRRYRCSRNIGFLHRNSKRLIHLLQLLLKVDLEQAKALVQAAPDPQVPRLRRRHEGHTYPPAAGAIERSTPAPWSHRMSGYVTEITAAGSLAFGAQKPTTALGRETPKPVP